MRTWSPASLWCLATTCFPFRADLSNLFLSSHLSVQVSCRMAQVDALEKLWTETPTSSGLLLVTVPRVRGGGGTRRKLLSFDF